MYYYPATILSSVKPAIHKNILSNLELVTPKKASRNDLSPLDGVDAIVRWMLNFGVFTRRTEGGGVHNFAGTAVIESSQTTSSLLRYGKGELMDYVTRFVEGNGIPQSFTSTNQLNLSFEDDDDLICEIV